MKKLMHVFAAILASVIMATPLCAGIGSWEVVAELKHGRQSHLMVPLDDGSILVIGGLIGSSRYVDGAMLDGEITNTVERFWPETNSVTEEERMHKGRIEACYVKLSDGDILVFGGATRIHTNESSPTIERYDIETKTWSQESDMIIARRRHSVCMLNENEVLIVGGSTGSGALRSAEIYNVETRESKLVSDLPQPVKEGTLVMLDGIPTYMGGRSGGVNSARQQSIFVYHRQYDSWISRTVESSLPSSSNIIQRHDGSMLMSGGLYSENPMSLENNIWRMIGTRLKVIGLMSDARIIHATASLGTHTAIISGGLDAALNSLGSCDFVNLTEGSVGRFPNMIVPRGYHDLHVADVPVFGLCVFAIGGVQQGPSLTTKIERLCLSSESEALRSIVTDVEEESDIVIKQAYPNPTTDYITVTVETGSTVRVLDIHGVELHSTTAHINSLKLDLTQYPRGMYLVQTIENGNTSIQKIIKN